MRILNYILDLAKKHTDSIGFIPRGSIERYLLAGQIILAFENDEPCGFLIHNNGYPRLKIYQACVQYDAQRRTNGLQMVGQLIAIASRRGCDAISLWCADDLPANQFWEAAGFQKTKMKQGGARRGRLINLWIYWIPQNCLFGQQELVQALQCEMFQLMTHGRVFHCLRMPAIGDHFQQGCRLRIADERISPRPLAPESPPLRF